jgi:hypothetical protein
VYDVLKICDSYPTVRVGWLDQRKPGSNLAEGL